MDPWRSAGRASFPLTLRTGDKEQALAVDLVPDGAVVVTIAREPHAVRVLDRQGPHVRVQVGDLQDNACVVFDGGRLFLELGGVQREFFEPAPKGAEPGEVGGGDGKLLAPTSGRIVAVHVRVGDTVRRGQPLIVLEAMKIENALSVGISGVVTELKVSPGDQVAAGRLLAVVTPDDGPGPAAAAAVA